VKEAAVEPMLAAGRPVRYLNYPLKYYWTSVDSEWAMDLMFRDANLFAPCTIRSRRSHLI